MCKTPTSSPPNFKSKSLHTHLHFHVRTLNHPDGGQQKTQVENLYLQVVFFLKLVKKQPPSEFICPIFYSLMFEPVVVSSGLNFERKSVQARLDLGLPPPILDGSKPDFTIASPNSALKS